MRTLIRKTEKRMPKTATVYIIHKIGSKNTNQRDIFIRTRKISIILIYRYPINPNQINSNLIQYYQSKPLLVPFWILK